MDNRLLTLLKELSYKEGTFTLKSGRTSDFYVDCRQTSLHPEGGHLIGIEMFNLIQEKFPSAVAVAGVADGAVPISTSVSIRSFQTGITSLQNMIVRKEAKTHGSDPGSRVVGHDSLPVGSEVVLLEDVVTTGGSSISAAREVEAAKVGSNDLKLEVVAIVALVDRQEGAREAIEEAGYDFESVFTRKDVKGE